MNYRHSFHAGNFADVFKHVVLTELLVFLTRKPTPFCYIDTHAGASFYDLFSEFAQKNKEHKSGIEKILALENPTPIIKRYIHCVHQLNNKISGTRFASLRYYPGSPMIAECILRPQDRMVLCELQPQIYQTLHTAFKDDERASVHHLDGYLGLKAFLPPRERRGLILIDPSYENADEFMRIVKLLPVALKRFPMGIYAIWYPIKDQTMVKKFHRALAALSVNGLILELVLYPNLPQLLSGCGLFILNPPWQFDRAIKGTLAKLWHALSINRQGLYSMYNL